MMNFDVTKGNIKDHNLNWPQIPDHPYRLLVTGGSGSGKPNSVFNQILTTFIYMLKIYEEKYQLLINKREST